MFGVGNSLRFAIHITSNWMTVDASDVAEINIRVHPPMRSFPAKVGAEGHRSDNFNAASPSSSTSDQDTLMMTSMFEMYQTAVIC